MGFCTAVNCMDGRVQLPVIDYLQNRFGVEYVDVVSEPGPNRILAVGNDAAAIESIRRRIDISVQHHGSVAVAVVGHWDCAGNPAEPDEQEVHTRQSVEALRRKYPHVEVIGLWVGPDWQVQEVDV